MIPKSTLTTIARRGIGLIILGMSAFFIIETAKFYSLTPEALGKYFNFKWAIISHIAGGSAALLTGPFLILKYTRERSFRLHRYMGRGYVAAVLLAGISALYLASTTALTVNWVYAFSLHVLASVWIIATCLAWYLAVKRKLKLHEEWAKRSYIITIAFVAQATAMYHPLIAGLGTFAETSPTVIWTSWTVPLFLFDMYQSFKKKGR